MTVPLLLEVSIRVASVLCRYVAATRSGVGGWHGSNAAKKENRHGEPGLISASSVINMECSLLATAEKGPRSWVPGLLGSFEALGSRFPSHSHEMVNVCSASITYYTT